METAEFIHRNMLTIQERVAEAALRSGRDPENVTLIAVSKTFPAQVILDGYAAGLRDFGENRPEEGANKIPQVLASLEGPRPTWHMIGHVQSRKAALVVDRFDVVHSVDRVKIARRLSRFAQEAGREIPILLECNVSGEKEKFGFPADRWQQETEQQEDLIAVCEEIAGFPGLRVTGLMTMAPFVDDPETVRPVFTRLRELREMLAERFPNIAWQELSMGMTDDFEIAVEEGATMIRIGRALFGERTTG